MIVANGLPARALETAGVEFIDENGGGPGVPLHGRSMEEEARHILRNAVKKQDQRGAKLGARIAARFAKVGLTTELPELRGRRPRSAEFSK
jgi:plasmid stability protein